jgi:hypothetical protein
MIGKAKSNKSLQATITYNEREKATLVYTNKLVGMSLDDYRVQMEDLQKCYTGYGKQLTIHAILSPAIEDGQILSSEQWQKMADAYLAKMNMQDLQAMGFLHADKEHRHLHLVINKVKEVGFKLVHDGYIGKKSQKIADQIAVEMKLVRAMVIKQNRIDEALRIKEAVKLGLPVTTEEPVGVKQQFKAVLEGLIKNSYHSVADYFKTLENSGFKVHSYRNKETGELRGYGIERDGTKMDASDVGKKFTLKALNIFDDRAVGAKHNCWPEEKSQAALEAITPLNDQRKIAVLENYALALGITKETLAAHNDIKMVAQGEKYFLAMQNDSGGYTLNNVYSKQYAGENDIITRIINNDFPTLVLENPIDYLLNRQRNFNSPLNYIILNSVVNKDKAVTKIIEFNLTKIILQVKNDIAGKFVAREIAHAIKNIDFEKKHRLVLEGDKNYIAGERKISIFQNPVKNQIIRRNH